VARVADAYDHLDYTKPELVEPVCTPCHSAREKARGKLAGNGKGY
jgi:hypothetical protein